MVKNGALPIHSVPHLLQNKIVEKMKLMALLRLRKTGRWGVVAFDRCQSAQLEMLRTVAVDVAPGASMRAFFVREPYRGDVSEYVQLTTTLRQLEAMLGDDDETEQFVANNLKQGLEKMMIVWQELFGKQTRCKIMNWFVGCAMKIKCTC